MTTAGLTTILLQSRAYGVAISARRPNGRGLEWTCDKINPQNCVVSSTTTPRLARPICAPRAPLETGPPRGYLSIFCDSSGARGAVLGPSFGRDTQAGGRFQVGRGARKSASRVSGLWCLKRHNSADLFCHTSTLIDATLTRTKAVGSVGPVGKRGPNR